MRLFPNLTWFAALLQRRARRPVRYDPADMGIALALDSTTIFDLQAALVAEAKAPPGAANDWQRRAERRSRL